MAVITITEPSTSVSVQEVSTYIVDNPALTIEWFKQLKDTPENYTNAANHAVTVKADESGLEFKDLDQEYLGLHAKADTAALADQVQWANVQNKPLDYPASTHTHLISEVNSLQAELDSKADDATISAALAALNAEVSTKLLAISYNATDVLAKVRSVDGSGSGLDADTLDGLHASQLLRSDQSDTINGNLAVDGTNNPAPLSIVRSSPTANQVGIKLEATGEHTRYFGVGTDAEPYWSTHNNLTAGSKIWHEGNDGAGSGLDADTLDGLHASQFLRIDQDSTTINRVTIEDELFIDADSGAADSTRLRIVSDQNRVYFQSYNKDDTNESKEFLFSGYGGKDIGAFRVKANGYHDIWHAGNDGAGSGLDADTLDGKQASDFVEVAPFSVAMATKLNASSYTATDVLNKVKSVDGAGSGLDADTLDGYQSSDFMLVTQGDIGGNTIWHAGNDGSGSGLDADLLDGKHAAAFYTKAEVPNLDELTLTTDGKLGLGISNPAYKTVVSNSGAEGIEFGPGYTAGKNLIQSYNRSTSQYITSVHVASDYVLNNGTRPVMTVGNSGSMSINSDADNGLNLYKKTGSSWNYVNFYGPDGGRDYFAGVDGSENFILGTDRHGGIYNMLAYADGPVVFPNQPSFRATGPSAEKGFSILFTGIAHNTGNHFNPSNGQFTAPVAGKYLFTWNGLHGNPINGYHRVLFKVNGTHSTAYGDSLESQLTGAGYTSSALSQVISLQAGDTVGLYNEGCRIYGTSYGSFSGILLG